MMRVVKILIAFCFAVLLSDASSVFAQEKNEVKIADTKTDEKVTQTVAEVQNPFKNQTNEKYRIGFQDTIEVQVYRHPELSQTMNVSTDGTILMPRIDRPIIAVCKTERQLSDLIASYLKVYLKNPFVNVRAVEQRSQPFAVVGAVEKPGNFYLNRKVRLLELLAFAGGPDVDNAGSKVQIARVGNITGCSDEESQLDKPEEVEFLGYNLNNVLKGKDNPWMQPGDIVSVLIAEEAFVVGNVVKQTKIILREEKTLTQALAEAGGVNGTAKTDKVIIQRQEPGSSVKNELAFNLKDIREGKIADPKLQANDIVQVDTDKVKSFKKGFTEIFKSIIPSAVYRIP
jgi:protein involved in polysaccharide export with SLBB domain